MGIDLTVHLSISRADLDQERLINDLNAGCPWVKRLVADWVRPRRRREPNVPPIRWELFPHNLSGGLYSVWIPEGGSVLSILPKRAEFWQGTKWQCIWYYPEYQHLLRWACFDLAQLLGSTMAMYTPEVVVVEGDTLDEVVRNLRRDRGDPALTISALQDADQDDLYSAASCYYIDNFDDLPSRPATEAIR